MKTITKPELLAPAGNLEILKIAFKYGADAVYCGTPSFAMRSRVGFNYSTLKEGIAHAHKLGKKVYVTLNAFPHPLDIKKLKKHINKLISLSPDAFIVADPGTIHYLKGVTKISIHLSTQANTTNQLSADFWKNQGVERVVLARELSLKEIAKIHADSDTELECFIHGAMCMAYSGRCQISNYLTGRDPNSGACIQACRFKYKMYGMEEEFRTGEIFPLYEDEEGTHILNSKDLCMIEFIPELIKAGIISFKIEGRLKSEYYVAITVRAYRRAIDLYFSNPNSYKKELNTLKLEVAKASNREFTTGFYFGKPDQMTNNYESSKAKSSWGYIGRMVSYDKKQQLLKFICKNHLTLGSKLEICTPDETISYDLTEMTINNMPTEVAHADNIVSIPMSTEVQQDSLIRVQL